VGSAGQARRSNVSASAAIRRTSEMPPACADIWLHDGHSAVQDGQEVRRE